MYFFWRDDTSQCLAEHLGCLLHQAWWKGCAHHTCTAQSSSGMCIWGSAHEKKALGGIFSISGIFLLACPTQHKPLYVLVSNQWQKAKQPTLSLPAASWGFYFLFFSSWESAPGHISGCQCLWVQRHSPHGAPEGEGREDPCSGSWHDQVGTEIPGGKRDETVCFGCSRHRGCSEVNGTFHRAGIIFFFQLNVIFPTQENVVMPSSCDCSSCGLNSSSEFCRQVELGCSSWELCNCQQLETFFQGKIPPSAGSIFQTRIVLSLS